MKKGTILKSIFAVALMLVIVITVASGVFADADAASGVLPEVTTSSLAADESTADESTADESTADESTADESTADESTADESITSATEEEASDESMLPPDAQQQPQQTPPVADGTGRNALAVAASITGLPAKGQDNITVPFGVGSSFGTDAYTASYNKLQITINLTFGDAASVGDKLVEIELADILGFEALPGRTLNINTGVWTGFDPSKLAVQEQDVISDIIVDNSTVIVGSTQNAFPLAKKATILVKSGITTCELKLTVSGDFIYYGNDEPGGKIYSDAIKVTAKQKDAGVPAEAATALETFTFKSTALPYFYTVNEDYNKKILQNTDFIYRFFMNSLVTSFTNTSSNHIMYKKVTFTLAFPKAFIGFQDADPAKSVVVPASIAGGTKVTTTDDATNVYLHFKFENNIGSVPTFTLKLKALSVTADKLVSFLISNKSFTAMDGTVYNEIKQSGVAVIIVNKAMDNIIPLPAKTNPEVAQSVAFVAQNDMAIGDNVFLGGFRVENTGATLIPKQAMQIDFTGAPIGVRSLRLPVGSDNKASNLKVTLSNGAIVEKETYAVKFSGSLTARCVVLDIHSLGVPSGTLDVFITKVEYVINEMAGNYGASVADNMITVTETLPTATFGVFIGVNTGSFTYKVSTHPAGLPSAGEEWNTVKSFTFITPDNGIINFSSVGNISVDGGSYQNTKVQAVGGQTLSFSNRFIVYHQAAANSGHNINSTTKYSPTYYAKGFEINIREFDSLVVDPSTIKIYGNNSEPTIYTVANGGIILSYGTDINGDRVVTLIVKDLSIGLAAKIPGQSGSSDTIVMTYEADVLKAVEKKNYVFSDLVQIHTLSPTILGGSNGNTAYFNQVDKYGVGSREAHEVYGTLPNTSSLGLTGQLEFIVTTSSQVTEDGVASGWLSYDYKRPNNNILGINPLGTAEYKVEMLNNTGQSSNGYSVLIPIPKIGEEVPSLNSNGEAAYDPLIHIQKGKFQWSATLTDELSISSKIAGVNYKILYSTKFVESYAGYESYFETWNPANKENYRMVYVVTSSVIPHEARDEFSFEFKIPTVNPEEYAGLTNIYAARVYRSVPTATGYKPSDPVAVKLNTAAVRGTVYDDINRNNIYEPEIDKARANVEVRVYKDEADTTPYKTAITAADGTYSFPLFTKTDKVWVEIDNPGASNDSLRFSVASTTASKALLREEKDGAAGGLAYAGNKVRFDVGYMTITTILLNSSGGLPDFAFQRWAGDLVTVDEWETTFMPTKQGYSLKYWYQGGDLGIVYIDEDYTVSNDITLYARWKGDSHNVNYWSNKELIKTYSVEVGEPVNHGRSPVPTAPVSKGYKFTGWADENGAAMDPFTMTMIPGDLNLYAQYKEYIGTEDPDVSSDSSVSSDSAVVIPSQSDDATPLAPEPPATNKTWALFSAILAVVGAFMAVLSLIGLFTRKDREGKPVFKILAIILGIVMVIIFFVMNDLTATMAYWNLSTTILLIGAIVSAIAMFIGRWKKEEEEQEYEEV